MGKRPSPLYFVLVNIVQKVVLFDIIGDRYCLEVHSLGLTIYLTRSSSKAKDQMANGQGSDGLIESQNKL